MGDVSALFACTKCHQKFPFGKLSGSQMQCSRCRKEGSKFLGPAVCTYCREEFSGVDAGSAICPKCQASVKQYGKPSACQICNVIAAFIGSKCKRCVVSEDKWGPPVTCDQCKQKCAFNRDEPSKRKVDKRILCWLCTIAYKRVLAKAKKKENDTHSAGNGIQSHKRRSEHSGHSITQPPRSSNQNSTGSPKKAKSSAQNLNKAATVSTDSTGNAYMHDMNIVLITQLRENVESLKKSLAAKEKELFDKERKMTDLKTLKMEMDKAHRDKISTMQANHTKVVEGLQRRNNELLKQVASLSKATKRGLINSAPGSRSGSPASRP
ncbi:protein FAM76A-like [Watersipora subatra]|uniref:protein FAM76A-like n=1 Tax=Watersipora subatra TaxID=2589382 RepID=UPI00355BAF16